MTPSPFTTYTKTVCALLRHATWQEKEAVQQELEDHLTDHAEALVESGWDEAHATQHALDAMGDPETVGEELNKAFPLRWLVFSRLAFWAMILVVVLVLWSFVPVFVGLPDRIQAQFAPDHTTYLGNSIPNFVPLKEKQVFSGGTVLSVYGMGIEPCQGKAGYYYVYLTAVYYHQNPFRAPSWTYGPLRFTSSKGGEELTFFSSSNGHYHGTLYFAFQVVVPPTDRTLTFHYSSMGTDYTFDFTPPWEEVLP